MRCRADVEAHPPVGYVDPIERSRDGFSVRPPPAQRQILGKREPIAEAVGTTERNPRRLGVFGRAQGSLTPCPRAARNGKHTAHEAHHIGQLEKTPQIVPEGLSELYEELERRLPGCVAVPLWLRGRVTGLLLCIGAPAIALEEMPSKAPSP